MSNMARKVSTIDLPSVGIGCHHQVKVLEWLPKDTDSQYNGDDSFFALERAYIQASLHADELPGMLVANHLVKLLDAAASQGSILKPITVVPYANPLGLSQIILGGQLGRFSLSSGVNFNRDWADISSQVKEVIKDQLHATDADHNVRVIRKAMWEAANQLDTNRVDKVLKNQLFKRAILASLVLDLHCDGGTFEFLGFRSVVC